MNVKQHGFFAPTGALEEGMLYVHAFGTLFKYSKQHSKESWGVQG